MTGAQVMQRAGINYRQLDYWTRAGYVPDPEKVTYLGSGYPRDYTLRQCHHIVALARLVRAGITLRAAYAAIATQTVDGQIPDVLLIGDLEVHLTRAAVPA